MKRLATRSAAQTSAALRFPAHSIGHDPQARTFAGDPCNRRRFVTTRLDAIQVLFALSNRRITPDADAILFKP
jgi:hypothetical protein